MAVNKRANKQTPTPSFFHFFPHQLSSHLIAVLLLSVSSLPMTDPSPPASLALSQSFAGSSSPSIASKLPKRRLSASSTLEFFAPAAKSFQPLPYTPHGLYGQSENRSRSFSSRHSRPHETLTLPGMDPLSTDPNVVFIHPPFSTFPNVHLYPDGLSYQVLADNPEWFLDPNDFICQNNVNPQATAYPPILEPPRGWCPARKKDLKDRGSEGWPEGEEPRLRCTFCRRTYAGVNAKSMWRRHVFEKHKIAMSNRRDGNDRPRGRGSGKENKQATSSRPREEPHDKLLSMNVAPQTNIENVSHKSKFRTAPSSDEQRRDGQDVFVVPRTPNPLQEKGSAPNLEAVIPTSDGDDATPEQSPPHSPSPQTSHPSNCEDTLALVNPSILLGGIPPSPYNPLATPSFRHSPPRLPSDQPWRFPSPSHPLHSQTRDVPLTMLAPSPLVKVPVTSGASPQSSPFSTPNVARSSDLKTPSTLGFSVKSGSRPWFFKNRGSPLDKHSKSRGTYGSSPLSSSLRGTPGSHQRTTSALSDDWFSENVLQSDPFAVLYSPWNRVSRDSSPRKVTRSLGDVSPVLRTGPFPIELGLGIGLLAPFTLPRDTPTLEDIDAELEAMVKSETGEPAGPSVPRKQPLSDIASCSSPPLKKRRVSVDC